MIIDVFCHYITNRSIFLSGILSHRWRLLFRPIIAPPEKVKLIIQAVCVLHNYLQCANDSTYNPPGFTDTIGEDGEIIQGFWRTMPLHESLAPTTSRNATARSLHIREYFSNYLSTNGAVGWQLGHINAR